MKTQLLVGTALCAVLALTGAAQQAEQTNTGKAKTQSANRLAAGNTFAMKAAQGGMAEVELGKLAQEHGSNEMVKAFGKRMENDHGKANDELKTLAANKGITLPTGLSAKDQATVDRLSKLQGAEFDRAYIDDMVKDHKTDIAEFKKESTSGDDADMKAFAAKTLPTLEDHLKMAEDTQKEVKGTKSPKPAKTTSSNQ